LRRLLTALRARLAEGSYVLPCDLVKAFGGKEALPRFQRLTGEFGRLLALWPAAVEAASDLRSRGTHLAMRL
jgi:hypothetical protein